MKTTKIAALSAASAFAVAALVLVYPAMAATLSGAQASLQATTSGSVSASSAAATTTSTTGATNATSATTTNSSATTSGSQTMVCQNMTSGIKYGGGSGQSGPNGRPGRGQGMVAPTALTAGETVTLTSTGGTYRELNSSSSGTASTGKASGSLTLSVSGTFKGGYALSITSGSLTIAGTTYNIASGSAEMGPFQANLVGQGTLNASAGSFLVSGSAHGGFFGGSDTLRFDVQANGVEYGVLLLVTSATS